MLYFATLEHEMAEVYLGEIEEQFIKPIKCQKLSGILYVRKQSNIFNYR